ncbi:hypothetical protein ABZ626_03555 [Streptomyces longispororuber]|uniref:hypothetical protein n=1 Tax=Streptomyces longispororuber TaxID=68230 RepID=UPI0033C3B6B3
MRELLGPVAAIALIAQANPDLPAPSIEFATVFPDDADGALGVRLHLHEPAAGVYERWAALIGSDDCDSHTRPAQSRSDTTCRRTYGHYAGVYVEAVAYLPPCAERKASKTPRT